MQRTDYYPFGLEIDRNAPLPMSSSRNNVNRFLYNGKELQVGTGLLDYGARMYMPEVGRWGVSDPMAEFDQSLSPYNYTENNPVTNIDPDGMMSFSVNGSDDEILKRGTRFGSMDKRVIGDCPSCTKDKAYDIYRDSKELFTYDGKTASVYNSKGEMAERAARPSEATTIGLPLWYSLGAFAENAPQVGLNALKVGVTIPLMTLAFVLSPTSAGEGSTVKSGNCELQYTTKNFTRVPRSSER
ncbi:RHS repeat-associated core domain-containing protein [Paucibacter sp. O1-1]|nr:RHS repeat-associated core domain-containing protein [Paucibacter sp. O1-1]MDA3830768.1 RHS repeat-associated core domain-containing protein [Paucibacter sp. O1-1]